jgi:hypothetical protein
MALLSELPLDHEERNKPLVGCWYKFKYAKDWKEIKAHFRIANKTYNELGLAWTENDIFCWMPDV